MKVARLILATLATLIFILFSPDGRRRLPWLIGWCGIMAVICFSGCASMLPIDEGSRAAEFTWLTLDAVDTAQTYQFAKRPQCFHETDSIASHIYGSTTPPPARILAINGVFALVHPLISRWFDEHADASYDADDDNVGLWFVGRALWHGISIGATGISIMNNYEHGFSPFHAPTCEERP